MSTVAPPLFRAAVSRVIKAYPSAVLSGIVPDQAHLDDGGYHVSIDDLRRYGNAGDYSNTNTLDKSPPVTAKGRTYAAAADISLGKSDMIKMHGRVRVVWLNRHTDTRAKYLNAINVWDGTGDPVRYNFVRGTATRASRDHTWHEHGDVPRAYVDDDRDPAAAARAARAYESVLVGQSHDAWLRQEHLGPYVPKPPATPKPPPDRTTQPVKPAPAPSKPATPPTTNPVPEDDDNMITQSYRVPDLYGYDSTGTPLTIGVDGEEVADGQPAPSARYLSIGLPPAGHKDHRWGKDYAPPYLSLAYDHVPPGTRVRLAIHDGKKWHVKIIDVTPGAGHRINLTVPPPATQTAYNITVGRVQPANAAGATPAAPGAKSEPPQGSIALLVEMIRR